MSDIPKFEELAIDGAIDEIYTIKSRMDGAHPELEELTMRMAQVAAILCVPHTLAYDQSGEVCYLLKRLDVSDCEVDTMRLIFEEEESTPNGSYEQIAEIIANNSTISRLDVLNFWEQVAFSWVSGCSSMGYLNFAMYQPNRGIYSLTPAFDLVSTATLSEAGGDELALSVNRKRRGISYCDFEVAMKRSGLKEKIIKGLFARFASTYDLWCEMIDSSLIEEELKLRYKGYIKERIETIKIPSPLK